MFGKCALLQNMFTCGVSCAFGVCYCGLQIKQPCAEESATFCMQKKWGLRRNLRVSYDGERERTGSDRVTK